MSIFESHLYQMGYQNVAGVDEAGRGPLAGPVVAAACLLPKGLELIGIDDSKKLTQEKREEIYHFLINHPDVVCSVSVVDAKTIDKINILQATLLGMEEAVQNLAQKPDYLLIDGNQMPNINIAKETVVSGDQFCICIAAASILAKCHRDILMCDFHNKWPVYGFDRHKGYGTKEHLQALNTYGPCLIHRRSFKPVQSAMAKKQGHPLPLI